MQVQAILGVGRISKQGDTGEILPARIIIELPGSLSYHLNRMTGPIKIDSYKQLSAHARLKISTVDEPLELPLQIALELGLKEGIILTPSQLQRLLDDAEALRCDKELAHLLALRAHSVGEVRARLKLKRFTLDRIDRAVRAYKKKGLLDDAQFAFQQGKKLIERTPCGRTFLVAFLQRKMIDRKLAESTAEAILCSHDVTSLATASLKKRWRQFGQFELEVARKKSYNYLARRGFGYDAARQAFERLTMSERRDDED